MTRRIPGKWWKVAPETHQFRQAGRIIDNYFKVLVSVTNVHLPEEAISDLP